MKHSCFWYQPATLGTPDIISYNGKILTSYTERSEAFNIIRKCADKAIRNPLPWCGYVNNYFYMKGTLDARDERNRILSFQFVTDEANYKEALNRELKTINIGMSEESLSCLTLFNRPFFPYHYITIIVCIVLICLILYLIVNH